MPSKELIEEIAFIIRHDKDGSPEDTARDILEATHAALREPTGDMLEACEREDAIKSSYVTYSDFWRAMLAASALGEQSE